MRVFRGRTRLSATDETRRDDGNPRAERCRHHYGVAIPMPLTLGGLDGAVVPARVTGDGLAPRFASSRFRHRARRSVYSRTSGFRGRSGSPTRCLGRWRASEVPLLRRDLFGKLETGYEGSPPRSSVPPTAGVQGLPRGGAVAGPALRFGLG